MIDPATYHARCGWCKSAHVGDAIACICDKPCTVGYCLAGVDQADPFRPRLLEATDAALPGPQDKGPAMLAVQPGLGR